MTCLNFYKYQIILNKFCYYTTFLNKVTFNCLFKLWLKTLQILRCLTNEWLGGAPWLLLSQALQVSFHAGGRGAHLSLPAVWGQTDLLWKAASSRGSRMFSSGSQLLCLKTRQTFHIQDGHERVFCVEPSRRPTHSCQRYPQIQNMSANQHQAARWRRTGRASAATALELDVSAGRPWIDAGRRWVGTGRASPPVCRDRSLGGGANRAAARLCYDR